MLMYTIYGDIMKKRSFKYLIVFFVLFVGISLGNVKGDEKKENPYPVENVESNFFMKLGHGGEVFISKCFVVFFDATGSVLKTIFGI